MDHWPQFLTGRVLTIRLSALAMVFGLAIGIVCALATQLRRAATALAGSVYVEFIRNTPFLIQLYFVFFALPHFGMRLDPNNAALLAMVDQPRGLFDRDRARRNRIGPVGQIEAGRSLGLRRLADHPLHHPASRP